MAATVVSVSSDGEHRFSKPPREEIRLLAGLGVEGDAHAGVTIQHQSRVFVDPTQPNLRQVHLIHTELFDELLGNGFKVGPGDLGENVTTRGIDLLGLARGTILHLGAEAVVEITGLRNPCLQVDFFEYGLLKAVVNRDEAGTVVRKTGAMGIVVRGGTVRPGDGIRVELPEQPHLPLEPV